MQKQDFANAEKVILESLQIAKELGHLSDVAFNIVKLGQVAIARGDHESALARYREGLAIFEKMGMPEANQVRQMIADFGNGPASPSTPNDPLASVIQQARAAHARGDIPGAIAQQEQAVQLAQQRGDRQVLFVQMVNLGQFYAMTDRFSEALALLDQALTIGAEFQHPELPAVREIHARISQMAHMSPEERRQARASAGADNQKDAQDSSPEAQLQAQLAALPPEQRAQAEAQMRRAIAEFQSKTPEEQAAILAAAQATSAREQIEKAVSQVCAAGLAFARREAPRQDVAAWLEKTAQQAAVDEPDGSSWLEVAALARALAALTRGETLPPVPARYAAQFSSVQQEIHNQEQP